MRDEADVAALVLQRRRDRRERVEQDLGGVGDEDQVVVRIIGRDVPQDPAGAAVFGQVALDSE